MKSKLIFFSCQLRESVVPALMNASTELNLPEVFAPHMGEASDKLIADWKHVTLETLKMQNVRWGYSPPSEDTIAVIQVQADELRKHLESLWQDHSDKTATELQQLAQHLSPPLGSVHHAGLVAFFVVRDLWLMANADKHLLAATVWWNWEFGKIGFQFLPNPAVTPVEEYRERARELLELFDDATEGDLARILTGDDLEFYKSLPDRLTVWRGCSGVSAEAAGAGVCWTTRRDIAVWFAHRSKAEDHSALVLMQARIRKSEIRLAKAMEFEIVTAPAHTHTVPLLKREAVELRPNDMGWSVGGTA